MHALPARCGPGIPTHRQQWQQHQLQHPILEQSSQHCAFGVPNTLASLNGNRQMKWMHCSRMRYQGRVSRLCGPVAYRALARRSEQPTKQATLALLRREPGAQSERVTDLGQTLTQRQGRWLSITAGHCGVAPLAAFSCRQT